MKHAVRPWACHYHYPRLLPSACVVCACRITCAHHPPAAPPTAPHSSHHARLHGPGVLCCRASRCHPTPVVVCCIMPCSAWCFGTWDSAVVDLCIVGPEASTAHRPSRFNVLFPRRQDPSTFTGKIACRHRHAVSCSAPLHQHSSPVRADRQTFSRRGWAPFKRRHLNLSMYVGRVSRCCSHLAPRPRHDLVARSLSSLQKRAQAANSGPRGRHYSGTCCVFTDARLKPGPSAMANVEGVP